MPASRSTRRRADTRASPPRRSQRARSLRTPTSAPICRGWGTEQRGVTRIVARTSRYVIDLNTEPRVPTPYEDKMPEALRSVLRRSACGHRWREPALPKQEVDRRIREIFEPYHRRVELELERARAEHGAALLLASHTFPDASGAADVVIGTRHAATASEGLREALADVVRSHRLTVALEVPFQGGYSCVLHARPHEGVSVVQLEVARRTCSVDRRNLDTDPDAVARIAHMMDDLVVVATSYLMSTTRSSG